MTTKSAVALWHKRMGYTYDTAAAALGMSRATYARYLKDPSPPRWLALACAALEAGIQPVGSEPNPTPPVVEFFSLTQHPL